MARHKKAKQETIKQETRGKLLQAAAQEFAEQGYDKANVNRIAENAGYSIGTLYNYFPTKRELMHDFIEETSLLHVNFILEKVRLADHPDKRLVVFFETGFEFIQSNIVPSKAIFNTLNGPDEAFKLRLFQAYQPLFQLLSENVIGFGISQEVFNQVDPVETASLIMLIYLGVGSQFNREGKLWIDASQVSEFVLRSLRKPGKEKQ